MAGGSVLRRVALTSGVMSQLSAPNDRCLNLCMSLVIEMVNFSAPELNSPSPSRMP